MSELPVPPPVRSLRERARDYALWGGIAVLLLMSAGPTELHRFPLLFSNSSNMRSLAQAFLQPDWGHLGLYVAQMWLTLQIALWGTAAAILLAVPLRAMWRPPGCSSRCDGC